MVLAKCLEAKTRCFFTICNNLTALTTRLHLEMWQLWCNDDDDNDDDKTDYFTPCACTWDNKYTLAQSLHRKLMPSSPQLHHETYLLTCRINTEAQTPGIFGHFILVQAQATRGGLYQVVPWSHLSPHLERKPLQVLQRCIRTPRIVVSETAMFGRVYSFSYSACQCRHA